MKLCLYGRCDTSFVCCRNISQLSKLPLVERNIMENQVLPLLPHNRFLVEDNASVHNEAGLGPNRNQKEHYPDNVTCLWL